MSRIVAIDFETANIRSASAIAIGYAVIEEGLITDHNRFLIKPHESVSDFLPQCIRIHHITPDMVEDKPSFKEIYDQYLKNVFKNSFLVAHNASFDMRVFKSLCALYKIRIEQIKYLCTVDLSNHLWKSLSNHKLPTVAEAINFNIAQNNLHHNPEFDALACAKIIIAAMKDLDTYDFNALCFLSKTKIGTILNTNEKNWNELKFFRPDLNNLKKQTERNYQIHPYYNKKIAKIGELNDMSMEAIAQHLINIGGEFHEYIINETDFVVLSDKYFANKIKPKYINNLLYLANEKKKKIISETEFKNNLFSAGYLDNTTGFPKYKSYEYI